MFWTYLTKPVGNNSLSYDKRKELWSNLKLFIPQLLDLWNISTKEELIKILDIHLKIGNKIVFEEVEKWRLLSKFWLDKYLTFKFKSTHYAIFDNHNVALYFIWLSFFQTKQKLDLIHIDQHSDMWKPDFIPAKISTLEELVNYTFEGINVGSYLIPTQQLGFVNNIFQVRTEYKALQLNKDFASWKILNIDLDFWSENMATTEKSLNHIKKLLPYSKLVLLATSPYFMDQHMALNLIRKLLV